MFSVNPPSNIRENTEGEEFGNTEERLPVIDHIMGKITGNFRTCTQKQFQWAQKSSYAIIKK